MEICQRTYEWRPKIILVLHNQRRIYFEKNQCHGPIFSMPKSKILFCFPIYNERVALAYLGNDGLTKSCILQMAYASPHLNSPKDFPQLSLGYTFQSLMQFTIYVRSYKVADDEPWPKHYVHNTLIQFLLLYYLHVNNHIVANMHKTHKIQRYENDTQAMYQTLLHNRLQQFTTRFGWPQLTLFKRIKIHKIQLQLPPPLNPLLSITCATLSQPHANNLQVLYKIVHILPELHQTLQTCACLIIT